MSRHPARQDDGPRRRAGRPLRGRVGAAGRPRGRVSGWPAAGSWPSIQTTFAIMPALVYLVRRAELAGSAISIGTLVAFTTLQTRLFFPMQPLLNVGVDIQTSLALFDRVFEYLDLPVDIDEPGHARRCAERGARRRRASTTCWFRYESEGEWTLRGVDLVVPAGTRTALVGETGLGQDDARLPGRAALRPRARARSRSTASTCATSPSTSLADARRRRVAGDVPVPRLRARQPALRAPGRDRRGGRGGGPRGAHPRHDRGAARGLRHGRRRARLPLLRRREAAHRDRADDPAQPADAACSTRRRARSTSQTERAVGEALDGLAEGRTTIVDRPPPLDGPRRRPDRRARRRRDRRARHPRGAPRRSAVATLPSWHATQGSPVAV